MVLEVALIDVIPGQEDDFATAYLTARPILVSTPGCRSVRMTRGIESPSRFVLLVEWDDVAAHEDNFRATERFAQWRGSHRPFFAEPPLVEHFADVPLARTTATLRTCAGRRRPSTPATTQGGPNLAIVVAHGFTGSWRRPAYAGSPGCSAGSRRRGELRLPRPRPVRRAAPRSATARCSTSPRRPRWARELGYQRVATLGFSMGASVVIRHAGLHEPECHAVAAVSGPSRWYYRGTIADAPGALGDRAAAGPAGRAAGAADPHRGDGLGPGARGRRIEVVGRIAPVPLLIVHGDADHVLPHRSCRTALRGGEPSPSSCGSSPASGMPRTPRRTSWSSGSARGLPRLRSGLVQ